MNERIQELAIKAEDHADGIVDQGGEFHEAYTKKFAELIVEECVTICNATHNHSYLNGVIAGEKIREYFGVK